MAIPSDRSRFLSNQFRMLLDEFPNKVLSWPFGTFHHLAAGFFSRVAVATKEPPCPSNWNHLFALSAGGFVSEGNQTLDFIIYADILDASVFLMLRALDFPGGAMTGLRHGRVDMHADMARGGGTQLAVP